MWLPPASDLASSSSPWPPDATANSSNTPVVVPQFGGWFQPHHGGGISRLCRFGADTQDPAFLFLVNGAKTLLQIINSSPRSSALVTAHGSLYNFSRCSNHFPCRYHQALGKDYQQQMKSLLHLARKRPFISLGNCHPGELLQEKGCTCIATGLQPRARLKYSPVIPRNISKLLFSVTVVA